MLSWLVGALLACWFLVTVLRNVPALGPAIARRDAVRMIPSWALFAKPQTVDMVLLRRDLLRDGTLTSWREVEMAGPRRWDPRRERGRPPRSAGQRAVICAGT